MENVRKAAALEREIESGLLLDATRRIEELETRLSEGIEEISALRDAQSSGRNHDGLNLAFDSTSVLPNRIQEMAVMPQVKVAILLLADVTRVFTKRSLTSILGGFTPNIIGRCTTSATELARNHGIREYLCPNTEHHACLPAGPGKHGYLQFGFGKDNRLFEKGEYRHVFVGTGKFYVYYGFYHVLRVESLTQHEWASLPIQMKMVYSDRAMQKDKSDRLTTVQQVLAHHESGTLRIPCVRLQCVAFNTKFHEELIQANTESLLGAEKRGNDNRGGRKRQRVAAADARSSDAASEDDTALALLAGARRRNITKSRRRSRCASSSSPSSLSGE